MPSLNGARRRVYYWIVIALPVVTFLALAATGRWQAFWRLFRQPFGPQEESFEASFTTAVIWSLSTLPITLTAWTLGRRHTAARRLNYELLVGFREIFRLALGRERSPSDIEAFTRPPKDRVGVATLLGLGVGLLFPTFFMSFAPQLRTTAGAMWLGGAGILMGGMAYCHRRASAYLLDEPRYFDLLRQYRLLNPQRYAEAGRPFVRAQIVLVIVFPIWWVGAGMAFLP
jgi:hypothetical protein